MYMKALAKNLINQTAFFYRPYILEVLRIHQNSKYIWIFYLVTNVFPEMKNVTLMLNFCMIKISNDSRLYWQLPLNHDR